MKQEINSETVLIVDDEETADLYLTEIMTDHFDNLLHAANGKEAVDICRNNNDINVILMDIKMPVMDGFTATRMIREFNKDVIIIAQTAYAMVSDRNEALKAGCNDYISKPIIEEKLLSLINSHISRKK